MNKISNIFTNELPQRKTKMNGFTNHISLIIKKLVKDNNLTYGIQKAQVKEIWERLMGASIAKMTTSVELNADVLYVRLSRPAVSQELNFGKEKIIKMLNEELGDEVIKKLVITS